MNYYLEMCRIGISEKLLRKNDIFKGINNLPQYFATLELKCGNILEDFHNL